MAPIIRQTILQRKLSFWKLILMVCGAVLVMDIAIEVLRGFSPLMGSIGGLMAFIVAAAGCVFIIYNHISHFNYKLIDDELIMERVFGRASHLFLNLRLYELQEFKSYQEVASQDMKKPKTKVYRFVTGRKTDGWYVGKLMRDNYCYYFIIEPNEDLLRAIQSYEKQSM